MFSDVDSLQYRRLGEFELDLSDSPGLIDYTETVAQINCSSEGFRGRVLLTFMNSKQLEESQVVAFSPIYLMNDEGRTVETI